MPLTTAWYRRNPTTNETTMNEPPAALDPAADSPRSPKPTIRLLTIERFRGIQELSWRPHSGLNVILGGGDVGKTTILDAIALLLSPTNFGPLSDTDYHGRKIQDGFSVEAVMTLPPDSGIAYQYKAVLALGMERAQRRVAVR